MCWWADDSIVTFWSDPGFLAKVIFTHFSDPIWWFTVFHYTESAERSLLCLVSILHTNWARWWWFIHRISCLPDLGCLSISARTFQRKGSSQHGFMTEKTISISNATSYSHSHVTFSLMDLVCGVTRARRYPGGSYLVFTEPQLHSNFFFCQ